VVFHLKRPSHFKLMLAKSCLQTQIGECEWHNNMLANCWREQVLFVANSLPTCCCVVHTHQFEFCQHDLANISLTCEGCLRVAMSWPSLGLNLACFVVEESVFAEQMSLVSVTQSIPPPQTSAKQSQEICSPITDRYGFWYICKSKSDLLSPNWGLVCCIIQLFSCAVYFHLQISFCWTK